MKLTVSAASACALLLCSCTIIFPASATRTPQATSGGSPTPAPAPTAAAAASLLVWGYGSSGREAEGLRGSVGLRSYLLDGADGHVLGSTDGLVVAQGGSLWRMKGNLLDEPAQIGCAPSRAARVALERRDTAAPRLSVVADDRLFADHISDTSSPGEGDRVGARGNEYQGLSASDAALARLGAEQDRADLEGRAEPGPELDEASSMRLDELREGACTNFQDSIEVAWGAGPLVGIDVVRYGYGGNPMRFGFAAATADLGRATADDAVVKADARPFLASVARRATAQLAAEWSSECAEELAWSRQQPGWEAGSRLVLTGWRSRLVGARIVLDARVATDASDACSNDWRMNESRFTWLLDVTPPTALAPHFAAPVPSVVQVFLSAHTEFQARGFSDASAVQRDSLQREFASR